MECYIKQGEGGGVGCGWSQYFASSLDGGVFRGEDELAAIKQFADEWYNDGEIFSQDLLPFATRPSCCASTYAIITSSKLRNVARISR